VNADASAAKGFEKAKALLEEDRAWCAYALADMEPPFVDRTEWLVGQRAAAMVYRGLTPPWLFAHGDPDEVDDLLRALPAGAYQYGLLATHRSRLGARLVSEREAHMWRMVLRPEDFQGGRAVGAQALERGDLPDLVALFGGHPDRPDSFDPGQLETGAFFGIRQDGELVAVAGTHVIGRRARVAAIGNVFTHPEYRRRGFAARASASVIEALLREEIETIVLNVAMANGPALALYRGLGFMPFCGYYEGVGELKVE
jgi:ribosomal protein S18 acetylase RimI-like enzyme